MHEVDARLGRDVGEVKLRLRWSIAGAGRATVQDDDERDGGQERSVDDALAPHWARKGHGVNDITGRVDYTRNARRARTCPRAWRRGRDRVGASRNLCVIGWLLAAACRGATPGSDSVASSAAAVTARTWGLAYLQANQLPQAEAEFAKVVKLAPDQAVGYA